jgi:hypothetical protein
VFEFVFVFVLVCKISYNTEHKFDVCVLHACVFVCVCCVRMRVFVCVHVHTRHTHQIYALYYTISHPPSRTPTPLTNTHIKTHLFTQAVICSTTLGAAPRAQLGAGPSPTCIEYSSTGEYVLCARTDGNLTVFRRCLVLHLYARLSLNMHEQPSY